MRRQIDRLRRDASRNSESRTLIGHREGVRSVAVLPDGLRALSVSEDRTVRLWDLKTGDELERFTFDMGQVASVVTLPDGKRALSGCGKAVQLWNPETGYELFWFKGHRDTVRAVAVLPDGRRAISGSDDYTLRLWDLKTGSELRRFVGHRSWIWAVAVLPDGRRALSGSDDFTIRLWDLDTGAQLHQFDGHSGWVRAVQTLPDGRRALSGSADGSMRLWDIETGTELRSYKGHTGKANAVNAVAVLPDCRRAISGSSDKTLRLWDLETGAELRLFEGHTDSVNALAILPDGQWVLSGSSDGTLRLWNIETVGEDGDTIGYTTARIALLGDSGVGKTGLGWRIAHGEFREHASTHGQQFWVIDQLGRTRDDGTQCEAVLWDLAGQPDYRLIHTLFLDNVDLGLLLFDPANRERPLAGIEYWMRHLRSATLRSVAGETPPYTRSSAPTLLVAARSDRGTPTLSKDEIEEFCRRHGIGAYMVTSARDNVGIVELIDRIKETIIWNRLTATTTTRTFKRIKEHVLALKETSGRIALLQPKELRQQLEHNDVGRYFTDAEMMTAVGHLANHGYVARLQRASGEEAILLTPDLLVNLASSVVLEARRHERGLGLLDEGRLLAGDYPLAELAGLSADVQTALLDAIASLFLQRNLCFRETINDRTCLVFPSLINEKRPVASNPGSTDDVSYRVSGAVETVYAALVVQLGYTNLFRRDHHWQNQAEYELDPGELCGFRQTAERDGEIELVLSFSSGAGEETRKLFQGAFERFLKRRPVQIIRLPAVICSEGHAQERVAVRKAIENARLHFFCDICGGKLSTPRLDNIGMPAERYVGAVRAAEATADYRTRYEVALAWVKAFRRDRGDGDRKPTCFISYAWGEPQHERWVEQLADHLQNADVAVIFDRWHCMPGSDLDRFIERIEASDFVCALGTSRYRLKDETQNENPVVQAELGLIKSRRMQRRDIRSTVIPLLCEGSQQTAFPPLLRNSVCVDFRKKTDFFVQLFALVLTVHRIPLEDRMARQHRGELMGEASAEVTLAST